MLQANFNANNAFLVADVKRDVVAATCEVRVAIREYGQLTFLISDAMLVGITNTLVDGELGYPLSDYIGTQQITGTFSRLRKSPTAAPSLVFTVQSIAS